jgi:hypothetical protein
VHVLGSIGSPRQHQVNAAGRFTVDVAGSRSTALDDHTLTVVERDKGNGPAARVKRIYTVAIPRRR